MAVALAAFSRMALQSPAAISLAGAIQEPPQAAMSGLPKYSALVSGVRPPSGMKRMPRCA